MMFAFPRCVFPAVLRKGLAAPPPIKVRHLSLSRFKGNSILHGADLWLRLPLLVRPIIRWSITQYCDDAASFRQHQAISEDTCSQDDQKCSEANPDEFHSSEKCAEIRQFHTVEVFRPKVHVQPEDDSAQRTANKKRRSDLLMKMLSPLCITERPDLPPPGTEIAKFRTFSSLARSIGAFRTQEVTILSGPTGCGKTTFLSQYCLDLMEQGVCTNVLSAEHHLVDFVGTMENQFCGNVNNTGKVLRVVDSYISLYSLSCDVATENNEETFLRMKAKIDHLCKSMLRWSNWRGVNVERLVKDVESANNAVGKIRHVVIDNLDCLVDTKTDDLSKGIAQLTRVFARLVQLAKDQDLHLTVVMNLKMETIAGLAPATKTDIYGGSKPLSSADNILMIQRATTKPDERYLQVLKTRHGFKEDVSDDHRVVMDPVSKRISIQTIPTADDKKNEGNSSD